MNCTLTKGEELLSYYIAILKTKKKINSIKESTKELEHKQSQYILKAYTLLDGMKVIVSKFLGKYSLVASIVHDDREKLKKALYLLEQTDCNSYYLDDYNSFIEDWECKSYVINIDNFINNKDIEIIEKITSESSIIKIIGYNYFETLH
ncbi:hypothetical protein Q3304_08320 [Clostridioides sp. GD02377]|uniref:hypothetical protein n=1 Tax=unclassified Clostridioides TaxID=2635829 RepID=UPI00389EEE61